MAWRKYFLVFFWATVVALSLRLFLIEDYRIFSNSMAPSLMAGDLVFVSKSSYNVRVPFTSVEIVRLGSPERGDVVAFSLPDQPFSTFVKRIVALEGEEVAIKGGSLYINGRVAQYTAAPEGTSGDWEEVIEGVRIPIQWNRSQRTEYGPVQVPQGHFFALGDNRTQSVDSRRWGPVPYSCLRGEVQLIWLSVGDRGLRWDRVGQWIPSTTTTVL